MLNDDVSIEKEIPHGVSTDAGGGGTREGLSSKMFKIGRACDLSSLLIATCVTHASNRMMHSSCQNQKFHPYFSHMLCVIVIT